MGHHRQSKRRVSSFLEDLLNITCSASWTVKIQNLVSSARTTPYEQLRSELTKQPQLFFDESQTKQKHSKAWLWVAVARMFAVVGAFLNCIRESLKAVIGDYSGIIINFDRAEMCFDGKKLQWCWSHLKREIQRRIDSHDNQVRGLGNELIRQQKLLFLYWRDNKASKTKRNQFTELIAPALAEFDSLLRRGRYSGNDRLVRVCDELYKHREWLWTFTEVQGVEPTNNTAKRALRRAVTYRKLSFATQSSSGSRYLEGILTESETCRLQARSLYQYLVATMEAAFAPRTAPSLLPIATTLSYAAA